MRYHYMDLLRGLLMALGVVLHAVLAVSPNPWNLSTTISTDLYMPLHQFIHSFRMQAFFLISGFFAALLLTRMSRQDYLRKRLQRILIPLVVCGLTLNLWMYRGLDWDASYWLGGKWLAHLWFLGYLALYMAATALMFPILVRLCRDIPYYVFAPLIAVLYLCATAAGWRMPSSPHGSYWLLFEFGGLFAYSVFFFAGVYLGLHRRLFDQAHSLGWNLVFALVAGGGLLLLDGRYATFHFFAGLWGLAITGLLFSGARRLVTGERRWVRFLADSSYSLYLFHQPLLVGVGVYFVWMNPHVFFIGSVLAVTLVCWGLHAWVVSPSPWLAYLFNGKPLAESPWLSLRRALGIEVPGPAKHTHPAWHRAGPSVRKLGQAGLVRAPSLAPKHRGER